MNDVYRYTALVAGDYGPGPGALGFQDSTWYLLARCGSLAYQRWAGMLAQLGVSPSQYKVLMALAETGPAGQQRLAELVEVDPRNAVPIIDALAGRGFVAREVDAGDRRRRVVALTSQGRRLAGELASVGAEIEADFLRALSGPDQDALRRLLRTLLQSAG